MFMKSFFVRPLDWAMILLLAEPPVALTQDTAAPPVFKQEELDQIVAPIALYPDPLISQLLIASTYPLEVVQAERFAKQNASLKGDPLTKALESQTWDPSVKSLVNFPQVLTMMSEKLDWTQKLGDAFLGQQKDVMDTIQSLRLKAETAGNLKTTEQQKIIVEQKIIRIEPASPQVIYVPAYNPTVVYGTWPYPAYPPYYYYPPGYVAARSAFWFASSVALGAAWGYAWGHTSWGSSKVTYNYNQNININNNINRNVYARQMPANAQGNWQHNPSHRQGVPYNNQAVAQKYNQASPNQKVQARQAYRGYTGSALTPAEQQQAQQRSQQAQQQQTGQQARQQQAAQQGQQQRTQQTQQQQAGQRAQQSQQTRTAQQPRTSDATANRGSASQFGGGGASQSGTGNRGGAFQGIDRGGSSAKSASQRGSASRSSAGGGRSGGGRR